MNPLDIMNDDLDAELATHLRRTLRAVAGTIDDAEPGDAAAPLARVGSSSPTSSPSDDEPPPPAAQRWRRARRGRPSGRSPRRAGLRVRIAVAGAAAAVALVGLILIQPPGTDDQRAWAADVVEVARVAPRLLVTADGWTVERVDEFDLEHGEITWATGDPTRVTSTSLDASGELAVEEVSTPGQREFTIVWTADDNEAGYPTYAEELAQLSERAERLPDMTIAGHEAAVFQTDPSPIVIALWKEGDYGIGIGGDVADLDEFRDVAASIEVVDVDTWLSALPPDVVRPADRADTVDEMLADIPLPAGFDPSSLVSEGGASEPYHLGARVTGAVACAWFDQWKAATAAGDTAAADEAVQAMATSHDWAVLHEMEAEGGWSEVVWEVADAMAEGGTIDNGAGPVPAADFAVAGLGCSNS